MEYGPLSTVHSHMDSFLTNALNAGGVVDITTIGRKSGKPRRIEIYFHGLDGELFITGRPGFPRDWLANLKANPQFTLHLRQVEADVAMVAEPIDDPDLRREVLYRILTESWDTAPDQASAQLGRWVADAPLVRFTVA